MLRETIDEYRTLFCELSKAVLEKVVLRNAVTT